MQELIASSRRICLLLYPIRGVCRKPVDFLKGNEKESLSKPQAGSERSSDISLYTSDHSTSDWGLCSVSPFLFVVGHYS
jgi:hypothetical protein